MNPPPEQQASSKRRNGKSESAFRTISEVAKELGLPQHVLRFWESKFPQIKPMKRGGGRRYYRPEDLKLLKRVRDLLYNDGYTIKGVQKLLKDDPSGANETVDTGVTGSLGDQDRDKVQAVLTELEDIRKLLP